ncbi:MAG: hypothetical protein P8I13_05745 [Porticoccaceae bacterium]|nr:hypothetical protein [Porticoccaceae bacterium]
MLRHKDKSKSEQSSSKRFLTLILLIQFFAAKSFADLPLTVEDLLTKKNQFRLSFNIGYANADRNKVSVYFDDIDTGNNNFVRLPVVVGEQRQNSDIFTLTLGGRYGLSKKTELYSRLTATANDTRLHVGNGSNSFESEQLSQFMIGVNHQFSEDTDSPALLGFAELALAENTAVDGSEYVHLKTGQIGFTTYRSIDPVVLSLTTGYRHSWRRKANEKDLDPGDLLFINPKVSFAVNNEVTLTGGMQFKFRSKDRIDHKGVGIRTSKTDLEFGLGYASSEKLTINLTISNDISGNSGAQANMGWLYKLKD